jgi:hypothetical protein
MRHRNAATTLTLLAALVLAGCSDAPKTGPSTLPTGVNLGGLFVLEDWFFSSQQLGHFVSTPCTYEDTGIASSQIFAQSTDVPEFTWTSETNLIQQLQQRGYGDTQVAALFQSHRAGYLRDRTNQVDDLNATFARLAELGIRNVRLPVTWAITYPDRSYTIDPGRGRAKVTVPATTDVVLIQDPFYPELKWASIPVADILRVLQAASRHGVKILIDVHAFPGGSSDGTYNGIWPLQPSFWNTGDGDDGPLYQQNFRTIVGNLIAWAESLYSLPDRSYADGLGGLTAMNEPAHLMGIPAARCSDGSWGISSYEDVLATLALAVEDFRGSSLPGRGVKLYMNVIETMFPTSMTSDQIYAALGDWWRGVTSDGERHAWAVLDIHHYFAWDPSCNNCLTDFVEDDVVVQAGFDEMRSCSAAWYLTIRQNLGLDADDLFATTEFSAGANSDTWQSCASGVAQPASPRNHAAYRNAVLEYQVEDAQQAGIDAFFWTWTIPYNANYQNEWALEDIAR